MNKNKKNNLTPKAFFQGLIFVFKKIWFLLKDYRKYFLIGFILIVFLEGLYLASQYFYKLVIDNLLAIKDGAAWETLVYSIVGLAVIYIFTGLIEFLNTLIIVKAEIRSEHYLSLLVFDKFLNLSLGFHEKQNTGGKLNKLNNGLNSVRTAIDKLIWEFLPTILRVVMSFFFLLFVNYRIALVFILAIPIFIFLTIRMNIKVFHLRKEIWKGIEGVYGKYGQALYNVRTVQAFVQEERETDRAKVGIVGLIKKQFGYMNTRLSYNLWRSLVVSFGSILAVCFGAYLAFKGEITAGDLVMFLGIAMNSYYSLFNISRIFDDVMEAKSGIENMFTILDSEEVVPENDNAVKLKLTGAVEFQNVSFDYGKGKILKNINFVIKPGETIALVGPSGAGKTTVAKLIYRYFDCQVGNILIDGHNIKDLNVRYLRRQLGVVNQDIELFDDTVKNNIAYGKARVSKVELEKAAKVASAHEFIQELEKGYDTLVGEKGVKLSGGQKQRLGIARAVLMDPKILILDEATSSLDSSSEKMIQSAIQRVIKNRTTIVIAHRLSTVKNADRIIVLDKGRIVEQGTHEDLMRSGGLYRKLVNLQVDGYLKEKI